MTIWIDILHTPQYNYYRNLITQLSQEGNRVIITVLKRGKTPTIIQREIGNLSNVEIIPIGKHRMTKLSAILEANILRLCQLLFWSMWKKFDVTFTNGFHASIIAWLKRVPRYSFGDDPQTVDFKPKKWFSLESNYCLYEYKPIENIAPNVQVLRCLKEWAYLAPKYFEPNEKALEKYGVKPKEYVFLREVSVGTVNYAGQERGAIRNIQHLIPKNKKVLFSLEEKNRRGEYPEDWILLQEPIEDIHSLIYYSAGLVSSGDSMAREAALLGVPSYYLGVRHSMPANAAASKVANLQNELTMPFSEWVKTLECDPKEAEQKQQELRKYIDSKFIDINEYMLSLVHQVEQEKIEDRK